jgi:hypothetical protein
MRKERPPSAKSVKRAADRAEGKTVAEPEKPGLREVGTVLQSGRPSLYKAEFVEQVQKLAALGATDIEICDFLEISTATFYLWRHQHPKFTEALVIGKAACDDRVERSLYNRAVGYTFESEKVFQYQGEIVRAQTREHVPPSEGAALSWLKNRRPDTWRDIQRIEHGGVGEFSRMTEAELSQDLLSQAGKLGIEPAALQHLLTYQPKDEPEAE